MVPLLLRFVNHFRPREGWPLLLLTLTALLCLPGALADANDDAGIVGLLILTILALIVVIRIVKRVIRASVRLVLIVGALLLVGAAVYVVYVFLTQGRLPF